MQTPSDRHAWIDTTRWHILNALADDWESPEQIANHFRDYVRSPIAPQLLADRTRRAEQPAEATHVDRHKVVAVPFVARREIPGKRHERIHDV